MLCHALSGLVAMKTAEPTYLLPRDSCERSRTRLALGSSLFQRSVSSWLAALHEDSWSRLALLDFSYSSYERYKSTVSWQSQSHITTDGRSVSMSWYRAHTVTCAQIFFPKLRFCLCGASSLTRGRVCLLSVFCQYSL
jgi:hypothetical protein